MSVSTQRPTSGSQNSGPSDGGKSCSARRMLRPNDRGVAVMDEHGRPRFRFRLRTLLFVVAILALLLVVVIQQVQISRQQVQIRQMRQQIIRSVMDKDNLTRLIRDLRDRLERAGSSSDGRHR